MRPVAFTMAVLAVLVAMTTVLGHRTHTEAVLDQNKATDQWNEYQAHKIRSNDTQLAADLLSVMPAADKDGRREDRQGLRGPPGKWADELKEEQEKAEALEAEGGAGRGARGPLRPGEALLEIGLVITSVTLLTRSRIYWYLGMVFSLAGVASALSVLLLK